ncbi:MAG: DUF559 domain-containing protein [Clostridia bacterium]|nr:DUF559 domain-containing protein [Clostridia bacterium]
MKGINILRFYFIKRWCLQCFEHRIFYPIRFLRQKVIDNYIVDFYCHEARLIIELDGSQHYEEKGLLKDKIRTEKIENRNLTVIRIPNNEVDKNFRGVCEYIDFFVNESLHR